MTERDRRGATRLRSNVVMITDNAAREAASGLIPGEIIEQYKPHWLSMRGARHRQRAENGYYAPCSYCERRAHEIGRDGCDDPRCVARPSDAQVAAARARHEDALAMIAAEREHIDFELIETERD